MMTNLPKRQRWLILIAGAGVLLLVLDRIVFTPLGEVWRAHAAEIAAAARCPWRTAAASSRASAQHAAGLGRDPVRRRCRRTRPSPSMT